MLLKQAKKKDIRHGQNLFILHFHAQEIDTVDKEKKKEKKK